MKHIHFIGICGVAMSALAIAFKKQGYTVTGSDAGFYPPVSTNLQEAGIDFYPGWHPEKMGTPDLVVVGNVASSINPEWQAVKAKNITYQSYPEVIHDFFIKPNSIVCAGTYGKTTTATLLSWILTKAGYNPSYMFGGVALGNFPAATIGSGDWSIVEGDEYKASKWDSGPKFAYYSPTHLLLTSIVWDHADVYPTEESYRAAFQTLIDKLPKNALLVASEKVLSSITIKTEKNLHVVTYGPSEFSSYRIRNYRLNSDGNAQFDLAYKGEIHQVESKLLGEYMAENVAACFALCDHIGIKLPSILEAIESFPGIKRRLEKRFEGDVLIFDDIAHSPEKAKNTLQSLKQIYADKKLLAVFEPNTGNRGSESSAWYTDAFDAADEVIIPRLTKLKRGPTDPPLFEGPELKEIIARSHAKVTHIDDDHELVTYLKKNTPPGGIVVFLGSHGFRGMIENLIGKLQKPTI
jgi:UDP-N-acetylmuramate: L-alanyl-gamma-D-glutamyl-meso-diaminopimelate ligase